jgi:hypothetical protein
MYLAWLTDFDSGLIRLPDFDTLNLTTDIWNGAHGGCDRSAGDAHSSAAPDPTFAFVEGPCCPTLDFVIAFDYDYVLHIVNFAILYCNTWGEEYTGQTGIQLTARMRVHRQ